MKERIRELLEQSLGQFGREKLSVAGTLVELEIREILEVLEDPDVSSGCPPFTEKEIRELGVSLVSGTCPGAVILVGGSGAGLPEGLLEEYQDLDIVTFVQAGLYPGEFPENGKYYVFDHPSVAYLVLLEMGRIFGNVPPGDWGGYGDYIAQKLPVAVNCFGESPEGGLWEEVAAYLQIPWVRGSRDCVAETLERGNMKIRVRKLPIPVDFANTYEGERIVGEQVGASYPAEGRNAWEVVRMGLREEIRDHGIHIFTDPENKDGNGGGGFAIYIEVWGKHMEEDFETVIERSIHQWLNYMEGVMHTGSRDRIRVVISRRAREQGVGLLELAEVLYGMVKNEYGQIVDRCQVTVATAAEQVGRIGRIALERYKKRDLLLEQLSDEGVSHFYTCTRCQSIAPYHCCVVTPQRPGLCGALTWLDAKATRSIVPTGPCQPVEKAGCLDAEKGRYRAVDEQVAALTSHVQPGVCIYAVTELPMTSCYRMECICAALPQANGVMVVGSEYDGPTPAGMAFSELLDIIGGGEQTPGFMGHSRAYITSEKFILGDGGIRRIVWMPKRLKEEVAEKLDALAWRLYGVGQFSGMICDETIGVEEREVLDFLEKKGHPALGMGPIIR